MNFDVLLSTLRQYRKGEVRSASLRFAARPTCGTCTAILISPSFHTASGSSGLGIAYTDLAKTENTVETASSSGHNHGHPHARTISSSSSSGSGSDQDYVRQPARSARNNRRRASTSATGYSTDGGSGRTVAFASPLTIGKTLSRSASVAPLSPTSPQTSSSNSTSNSDSTTSSHTQNYRSGSFTARRRSSSSAATNPTASYPYSSTLRFAPPEPTSYSGTRPAIIPGVKYPIQPPASPEIGISVGGKSGPPLPQVTEANPGGTARRRRRASTNLAPSSGMVVPPYTPATYNGPLPVPLPPAVPMGGFPYPYPYPAAAVGAVKLSPPTSSSSTSTATSRTSSSSAGMSGYMNLGIPGMPSMNPPPHYRHASDRGPTTNTGSNDNSQLRPPMPKHKRSASTPGLAVPAGNGNGSVSPASESATSSGASWSTSNSVNVLNNTANLNTATNTSRSSKRISSGYQQFNPPSAPVPSAAAAAAVMGDMGVAVVNPASGSYPYGMGIDHSYAYTGIMEHGKLASHPRSNNTSAHMGLGMGMGMGAASAMPLPLTWPTSGSASSGSSDGSNSPYAGNSSAQSSNPRMRRPTQSKVYSIDHANGLSIHNNGVAGGVGALAGGMQGMSISNN
ncbi:hypothetical protein DL93DRAFT_840966 [Clavulina sp. PMI_390]|nr:hypothetical protein DL93DRAFT_840966 [Clavulina sp. PMI_390]